MSVTVGKFVDGTPDHLEWISPRYLDINWEGDPNGLLTPAKELTRDEFDLLRDHGVYGLRGINYDNTIRLPDTPEGETLGQDKNSWTAHYYFYPYKALALCERFLYEKDYNNPKFRKGIGDFLPKLDYDRFRWGYARRYFQIGCAHEWRELSQAECKELGVSHYGSCWHVEMCKSCGQIWSYDSSG